MMENYYIKYKDKIQNQHFVLKLLELVIKDHSIIKVKMNFQLLVQIQDQVYYLIIEVTAYDIQTGK